MHKISDDTKIQTALDKAEKRLAEAIELAKNESNKKEDERRIANKAVADAMFEFKKAAMEEQRNSDILDNKIDSQDFKINLQDFNNDKKTEDVIKTKNISEAKNIKAASKEKLYKEYSQELYETGENVNEDFLNEEFHDGYDSFKKMATYNKGMRLLNSQSPEESILSESQEYVMKCFNEKNIFDENAYEISDIMPSDFSFYSFSDEEEEIVKPYDINEALILGDPISLDDIPDEKEEIIPIDEVSIDKEEEQLDLKKQELLQQLQKEAEETLEKSRREAKEIIDQAQHEAKKIIDEKVQQTMDEASKKGFDEGFKKGESEGYFAAENAVNDGMIQEAANFKGELEKSIKDFEIKKTKILDDNINELTDLAINVAEKIVKISLKSSKEVVAKMIVAATEDCRNKEWAKVYISHEDKAIAMNLEKGLIDVLNQISSNVKVVVMEDEPSGTCIIETPDQIVDASVGPQLDNIRQIVSDNKK